MRAAGDTAPRLAPQAPTPPTTRVSLRLLRSLWPAVRALLFTLVVLPTAAVTLEFPGARSFPEPALREALVDPLELIDREGLTAATADDAAFFLELFYRRNGFSKALVTASILGRDRLRLQVDEGVKLRLGELKFLGARSLPEQRLRDYFLAPTRSREAAGTLVLPYIASDLQSGLQTLQTLYQSEGYLQAQVALRAPLVRGEKVDLTVVVREGRQSRFGLVRTTGLPPAERPRPLSWLRRTFEKRDLLTPRQRLDADLAELARAPYTPATAEAMAQKTLEYLKSRGHYSATAKAVSGRPRGGLVPVTIAARPGPVLRFGDVRVSGTQRLKPDYVRNRFLALRGQRYSPERLDAVFAEEMRTGLFQNLRLAPQPEPDGTLRLDVTVAEAKAREFGVSGGFSSFDGPLFGVEYRNRNFRGTGRPLSLRVDYSARTFAGEVLYEDPHLFETDNRFRARLSLATRDLDSYTKREAGLLLSLGRRPFKGLELGVFAQIRAVEITELKVDPAEAGRLKYVIPSVGATLALDWRDSPLNPLRGLAFNASADLSAGQFQFLRATGRLSYYLALGKSGLSLGLRGSILRPLDGGGRASIPIDERFFLGGSTTVRSFAERRLGPRDATTGKPTGGLTSVTFNAEYTFPIWKELKGAVFYDAGALARDTGLGAIRQGVGAGLRYALPIGPLRIDYGFNPSPRSGESRGALHIAFGVAF